MREQLGLTGSYPEQYWNWASGVVTGDFGESYRNTEPVADVLSRAVPITLELMILALLIATLIGVPLGVISAVRRDSVSDYGSRVGGLVGISIPSFWLATLLLLFTSRVFRLGAADHVRPVLRRPAHEPEPVHPARDLDLGVHARDRDADGARDDARGAQPGLRAHRAREGRAASRSSCTGTRSATR